MTKKIKSKKESDLRKWRKRAGLTQQELAKMIDITPVSISRYENGRIPTEKSVFEKFYNISKGEITPNCFFNFSIPKS